MISTSQRPEQRCESERGRQNSSKQLPRGDERQAWRLAVPVAHAHRFTIWLPKASNCPCPVMDPFIPVSWGPQPTGRSACHLGRRDPAQYLCVLGSKELPGSALEPPPLTSVPPPKGEGTRKAALAARQPLYCVHRLQPRKRPRSGLSARFRPCTDSSSSCIFNSCFLQKEF